MEEKEVKNVYAIPANYTDSGKLFGGMVETRNAVEAGILLLIVGYPEFAGIPMPGMIRIVVMVVTLIPLAVMGHICKFWIHRRKLHMRRIGNNFSEQEEIKKKKA